jgi:hypothetical protein
MPNARLLENCLANAQRHVDEGAKRIKRQLIRIEHLQRTSAGAEILNAKSLLMTFYETQNIAEQNRDLFERALENLKAARI